MNTTIRLSFGTSLFLVAAAGLAPIAVADQPINVGPPEIISHRTNPQSVNAPTAGSTSSTSPILYRGGPVMATPTAYVIWYGDWNQNNGTDTPAGQAIVTDFLQAIGGSPYFAINKNYSAGGTTISGNVIYGGAATDTGSQGTKLTDSKITAIVQSAISTGKLASDPNGVYFVLTSSNVSENSGFCNRYCGWHTRGRFSGVDIKYAFVGNAARCLNACAAQSTSPNGNAGVDGMISVVAHELEEATSDPDLNAWYDNSGAENADKCAWTFGKTTQLPGGAWYNMILNGRYYLIQRNLWRSGSGDYCGMSLIGNTLSQ